MNHIDNIFPYLYTIYINNLFLFINLKLIIYKINYNNGLKIDKKHSLN